MEEKMKLEKQWISDVLLPEILNSGKLIVDDFVDTFKVRDIKINFIGGEEAFMLTICYRATVEFEFAGKTCRRSLVVKKTPPLPIEIYNSINFSGLFGNEVTAYSTIMPVLQKISAKVEGLPKIDVPRYFYSDLQLNSATLVLEDFGVHGWRVSKDKVNLSLEHIEASVKYLALFHGTCYAFKDTDRSAYDNLVINLRETRYANSEIHPEWDLTIKTSINRLVKATQKYQNEVDIKFLENLTNLVNEYFRYGKHMVQPVEPLAILCHGDYLRNNIAYKYGKEKDGEGNEVPEAAMMFDLQTLRVSSPMVDLSVLLAVSAYAEVRQKNFTRILNTYWTTLVSTYETYTKTTAPEYLSFDSLLRELIRFLPYGLMISASFLMTLVDPPPNVSSDDFLIQERTTEEIVDDAMTRGGEVVDRELSHQVKEMYDLSRQYNVDLFEGFEL
ncbi:uncharacterized protein LOC119681681 [Teleopsis dalmanni]|uniref:uncharacterized protein LOC119681681 n=1 Tax=Teleopsis dalmanni TaxID=139649 RepID=UPI0018CD9916|nr:uncharacterized protein LOC119681681 [Teleopsis dalmanni]